MTAREELIEKAAQAIANVENGGNVEQSDRDVAAVILDAILPQVSTVAELEALPVGTLLLNPETGQSGRVVDERLPFKLPLTVVWTPDEVTA